MSSMVKSATKEPRRGSSRTKPSARSCLRACLTGPRLICNCRAILASTNRSPKPKSPARIRSRSSSVVLSDSVSARRRGAKFQSLMLLLSASVILGPSLIRRPPMSIHPHTSYYTRNFRSQLTDYSQLTTMLGTANQWADGGKSDGALTGRQHTGRTPARGARLLPGTQAAPTHMARGWLVAGRRLADDGGSLPNCRGLFHRWDIRSWREPDPGGRGHAHCSVLSGVGHHVPNRRRDVLTGEERFAGPHNVGNNVQLPAARYRHPSEHCSWRSYVLAGSRPCPGCHIHAAARFD